MARRLERGSRDAPGIAQATRIATAYRLTLPAVGSIRLAEGFAEAPVIDKQRYHADRHDNQRAVLTRIVPESPREY